PDVFGVSWSYPLPGTKFFERVHAQLGEKTNWSDSEDLAMLFQGAYTNEFYRALHDALYAQVDSWNSPGAWCTKKPDDLNQVELWKRVVGLETTCRNSRPTVLPGVGSDPLVHLQTASGMTCGDD